MADVEGALSKSAKKRMAKKAKEAAEAEPEPVAPPPPPPAAEPKSKAKGKAKADAKAKVEPKAEPKVEPKSEPKAKAKGKAEPKAPAEPKAAAKAEPKAVAEPKAAAVKQKAKGGAKAKAAPKKEEEEEEEQQKKKKVDELINYVMDDGGGGDWEVSSGLTAKAQKKKDKKAEEEAYLKQLRAEAGGALPKNAVPGMAPIDPKQSLKDKANACQAASADVARILAKKDEEAIAAAVSVAVATINVPDKKIGIVIGPGGANIKLIQEKTKVTRIDTAGGIFTISGPGRAVEEAQEAINQLITKGFCSILYDDFAENYVNVHPSYFPDIIGKQGAIIQKLKKELKVEISIPQGVEMDNKAAKKYKVTLAGSAKQVEEAKEVLNSIIMYGHHEITHPGLVHEELEVEKWSFSFIIGKGGSELKHIQKNWDVKVAIPRETSVNQKVLIVGEQSNVERAKAYVEKVLWNAENQVRGRDKADKDDGDGWGAEDDEEPWMKEYIYRRA